MKLNRRVSGSDSQVFYGKFHKSHVFLHATVLKAPAHLKPWILPNFWFYYNLNLLGYKYSSNRNYALFLIGFVCCTFAILHWSWLWISVRYYAFQILNDVLIRKEMKEEKKKEKLVSESSIFERLNLKRVKMIPTLRMRIVTKKENALLSY